MSLYNTFVRWKGALKMPSNITPRMGFEPINPLRETGLAIPRITRLCHLGIKSKLLTSSIKI